MRDPKRIEPILEEIRRIWTACPDLRLAQLLVNVIRSPEPCPQIFYFEDDKLLERLRAYPEGEYVQGE
jgi:hypothetical protein